MPVPENHLKKKTIALVFRNIESEHLGKDVFLTPYYIGKIYDLNVDIVYSKTQSNKNLPGTVRGARLIPLTNIFLKNKNEMIRGITDILYVLFHAKKIDILMRFFLSNTSSIAGLLYKFLNKNGILYIKCDSRPGEWPLLGYYNSVNAEKKLKIEKNILRKLYATFLDKVDIITVETKSVYETFIQNNFFNFDIKDKVRLLPSGFDKELFEEYDIKINDFSIKENLILTVGRIGSYPKNTEMLLRAIERLNIKNWKIILIGPIEKNECDFQKIMEEYYIRNPHLKNSVIFTGPIYDKKELWNWFNRAKVFVFTSLFESFGLVLDEALFFKNYIVSTDVGAASDLINIGGYGETIPQNDDVYLSNVLQEIISENKIEKAYHDVDWKGIDISWEKNIRNATDIMRGKL